MTVDESQPEYWVFGYGSLIFKPPPFYDLRVPGYIKGYVRRFWQSSNDHRGTPDAPGRVVTLIDKKFWLTLNDPHPSSNDDITWGVAYRIKKENIKFVKEYLDHREKNGYTEATVVFQISKVGIVDEHGEPVSEEIIEKLGETVNCNVYIGTPENEAFVGPQDPQQLAQHIVDSRGPSGENREYLFELAKALKVVAPESFDHHIEDLVDRVNTLI
ncbi:Gcg1p [Sugiyamaella lignohabitans]|uniref:glutathione-specific gamma-glutamylcyclotransferase n=1 Tax=Sugiyamaella lignohabitans TaxID=796027 RepID=A0A167FPG8_9ASCO|nr:Gcg1p [Sugiyamaella lignohabitans]ANB15539.1 Gcg1p [Sugiyamaella lignohabitans]